MFALLLWPRFQFSLLFEGFKACILASLFSAKLFSAPSPGFVLEAWAGSQGWTEQAVTLWCYLKGVSLYVPSYAFSVPIHQNLWGKFPDLQVPRDSYPLVFSGMSTLKQTPLRGFPYAPRDETQRANISLCGSLFSLCPGWNHSGALLSRCGVGTST